MSPGRAEQRHRATVARSKGDRLFCGIYSAEQRKSDNKRFVSIWGPRLLSSRAHFPSMQIRHLFCWAAALTYSLRFKLIMTWPHVT